MVKECSRKKSAIISTTLNSILTTLIREANYKKSLNKYRYTRSVSHLVNLINTQNLRVGTLKITLPTPSFPRFAHLLERKQDEGLDDSSIVIGS